MSGRWIAPENQAGLFYVSMGLFHPDQVVREATADLLGRISRRLRSGRVSGSGDGRGGDECLDVGLGARGSTAGICQLLTVAPENQAGLFYVSMGLFHPDQVVREATADHAGVVFDGVGESEIYRGGFGVGEFQGAETVVVVMTLSLRLPNRRLAQHPLLLLLHPRHCSNVLPRAPS
jgi:hypothetical protein